MNVPRGKPKLESRSWGSRWNLMKDRSSRALRRGGSTRLVDTAVKRAGRPGTARGVDACAEARGAENQNVLMLTSFHSGELEIVDDRGRRARLSHATAHRLILAARMHSVQEFVGMASPACLPSARA